MNKRNVYIECIVAAIVIACNLGLSLILDNTIFKGNTSYLIMLSCGISILTYIVISIIASKLNYKLDLLATNIEDTRYLIINSVFVFSLVAIPLSLFISLI